MAKYNLFLGDIGKNIYDQNNKIKDLDKLIKSAQTLYSICAQSLSVLINAEVTVKGSDDVKSELGTDYYDTLSIEDYEGVKSILDSFHTAYADIYAQDNDLDKEINESVTALENYLNKSSSDYDGKTIIQWYIDQFKEAKNSLDTLTKKKENIQGNINSLTASQGVSINIGSNEILAIKNLSEQIRKSVVELGELLKSKNIKENTTTNGDNTDTSDSTVDSGDDSENSENSENTPVGGQD